MKIIEARTGNLQAMDRVARWRDHRVLRRQRPRREHLHSRVDRGSHRGVGRAGSRLDLTNFLTKSSTLAGADGEDGSGRAASISGSGESNSAKISSDDIAMTKKPSKKPGSQAEGVRGSLWSYLPSEYTIVGFDTDDVEHELCHHESNAFDAEHYDEYIQYMRLNGVDRPVIFRRDGDRRLIVEGRTTIRVARVVAPFWESDRKAEGLKGDDCKLRVPGVLKRGTADELFCTSRATNRRRPGSDDVMDDARALARLVNNGATEAQAAVRLGMAPARGKQLIALLQLDPKLQRKVGSGVSLDAAAQLAKLPAAAQLAKFAEIEKSGEKPTARAVRTKLDEGSGKPPSETPAQKLKRIAAVIDDHEHTKITSSTAFERIRAILRPPVPGCARCGLPKTKSDHVCVCGHRHDADRPDPINTEFGA